MAEGELPFLGLELSEILQRDWPVNNAGCFCTTAHVAHKVLLALHTVNWWLENGNGNSGGAASESV